MENRKMLKGTVRVSDVERICQANHERRKLAEECDEARIATAPAAPRNDRRCKDAESRKVLRTAFATCLMASGGGAAFLGMGISMGHWPTIIVGTAVAVVFLMTGARLEGQIYNG